MRLVVSPYHLTTREPVAMACLLLGERVVTLLPSPPGGLTRERLREALRKHPAYLRLLESWRWSGALWRAGVIESADGGDDALAQVRAVAGRARRGGAFAALGAVLEPAAGLNEGRWLDRFCTDVLKGGPDPSVCVAVASGLDAFAGAHRLTSARSAGAAVGASISQRAEALLGRTLAGAAVPVLLTADGQTLLRARAEFEPELAALRAAFDSAAADPARGSAGLRRAATEYAAAFEACRGRFVGRDDGHGQRVTAGYVTVTLRTLPADAVLMSALAAVRTVGGAGRRVAGSAPAEGRGAVSAVVVGEMSVQPSARP